MDKLKRITSDLKKSGIDNPQKEAELIIVHAEKIEREVLFRDDPELSIEGSGRIDEYLDRRLQGEPLQYILGYVDFYGLKIRVGRGVLIPRPETELLVDNVIKSGAWDFRSGHKDNINVLDLCTGSGCMALAIANNIPDAEVYATDISGTALEYARENARLHGIDNVTFLLGDLFDPVRGKKFHVIVSNPPYIKSADIPDLQGEIRDWEPVEALDAGEDGLEYYRRIISDLGKYLVRNGQCFLEIGFDQRYEIESLVKQRDFNISFRKDLAGYDRTAILSF
ncbi:MAG: peptide chain release factor N(5)-glutamine methyltransferase [Thermodesulfovibrionales bacterium]